jgi:tetratricopeptide (TPR) repeat protein
VREGDYEAPESVAAGLPSKIYAILNRAVAKEPGERYQSCSEMLADLEECMIELSLRPTARGLAQYMNGLFDEEIVKEDRMVRELSGVGRAQEPEPEPPVSRQTEPPLMAGPEGLPEPVPTPGVPAIEAAPDVSVEPASRKEPRKKKPLLLYAGLGALVVIAGLGLAFWPREKASNPPQAVKPLPAVSTATPSSPAPATTTQAKTQSEDEQKKARESAAKAKALQDEAGGVMDQDPRKAKSLLLEAIKLDPAAAECYFRLGLVYVKLKEFPGAIETYRKVAEMDPDFPDIYFNLGFAYAMNKDYPSAEEMYAKVVRLAPRYIDEALFNLALVQEKQAKKGEAIANLQKALAANPKNAVIKENLERLKKGQEKNK